MAPEREDRPTAALSMWGPVTDGLFDAARLERLESLCRVPRRAPVNDFGDPAVTELLAETEILVTSWGTPRVGHRALERMPKLRLVANAAGTVRWVLSDSFWATTEGKVQVVSAAAANAIPVAEFTLAAIIFGTKRAVPLQRRYAESREWKIWSDELPWIGLRGRTIGIVGAGRIGRRVIELLHPFEVELHVYDPYLSDADAQALGVRKSALDTLMATSDVVTLHAPDLPDTRNMIDARHLALMRDGAVLINTARGGLIDNDALIAELQTGRIDAIIDVTEPETLPEDHPLYDLPNVFLTPHIAGSQGSEIGRMADLALDEIERFIRGEPLRYAVRERDLDTIA
jgi:phosphoglycerate dehydrogenase-like enzyme